MRKDELHFRMRQRIVEVSNMKPERISPALSAVIEEASWTAIEHMQEQGRREAFIREIEEIESTNPQRISPDFAAEMARAAWKAREIVEKNKKLESE